MQTLFKLTTQDNKTRAGYENECIWGENITHHGRGLGYKLCTSDLIHAYKSPFLAMFCNPIHANIQNPKIWLAEGNVVAEERGLKVGCKSLTTIREIDYSITPRQQISFALLCVKELVGNPDFHFFADLWLENKGLEKTIEVPNGSTYWPAIAAFGKYETPVNLICKAIEEYKFSKQYTPPYVGSGGAINYAREAAEWAIYHSGLSSKLDKIIEKTYEYES